ncbi:MAG: Fe-S cluster assembly protein SufD [Parachlamydiales bacterium]|jgi:Fe-S cluster assembly protein SufD
MMTLQYASEESFDQFLERIWDSSPKEDLFGKLKQNAWEAFLKLGLPTRKTEVYSYVTLRKLFSKNFAFLKPHAISKEAISPYILPECRQSVLVFINGSYSPELSNRSAIPASVTIDTLNDAYRTYGSFITNAWKRNLTSEKDPFYLINAALHHSAAFIYVPPKVVVEAPIQILSIIDAQDQIGLIFPRWHLFAGNSSQVKCCTTQAVLSGDSYVNMSAIDFNIEENAQVELVQLVTTERDDAWTLDSARAHLKRNSTLNTVSVTEGGEAARLDWHVVLAGENGEANLSGLGLCNGKHEGHAHILMEHQAPHCRSMQFYRNVIKDTARSSFEGKIYVHQEAQKTDAYQMNNNLLLSDNAQAYSKPNLEIFADDVKASHGCTIGQLDDEQLFYLKARGLSQEIAQHLLIQGFCSEVIDKITIESLLKEAGRTAAAYVSST